MFRTRTVAAAAAAAVALAAGSVSAKVIFADGPRAYRNDAASNDSALVLRREIERELPIAAPQLPGKGAVPQKLTPRQLELFEYGVPRTGQLQVKEGFASFVNYAHRQPAWVLEHLTKEYLVGDAERATKFLPDEDVPPEFRAVDADYQKSGYSRGHMAPAGDFKSSQSSTNETFLLSTNIVPQNLDNNRNYWNMLENWTRNLVLKNGFDDVYVITGPLFLPNLEPSPPQASGASNALALKKARPREPVEVKYQLIGESNVAVPTHLFKAVLTVFRPTADSPPVEHFAAFVIPNEPIPHGTDLRSFEVPHSMLEHVSGVTLFPRAFEARQRSGLTPPNDLCSITVSGKEGRKGQRQSICSLWQKARETVR